MLRYRRHAQLRKARRHATTQNSNMALADTCQPIAAARPRITIRYSTIACLRASACLKKALVGCGWFHAGVGAGEEFGLEVASGCDGCSQTGSRDDYGGLGCCRRVRFLSRSTTRCDFAVVASVAQAASRRVSAAVLVGAVSAISRRPNVCRLRPRIASDR